MHDLQQASDGPQAEGIKPALKDAFRSIKKTLNAESAERERRTERQESLQKARECAEKAARATKLETTMNRDFDVLITAARQNLEAWIHGAAQGSAAIPDTLILDFPGILARSENDHVDRFKAYVERDLKELGVTSHTWIKNGTDQVWARCKIML